MLLETDLLADGQAAVEGALPWLEQAIAPAYPAAEAPEASSLLQGKSGNSTRPAECDHHAGDTPHPVPPGIPRPDLLALVLECYNALGALQSARSDFPAALAWLEKAEELYGRHLGGRTAGDATVAVGGDEGLTSGGSGPTSGMDQQTDVHMDASVEAQHTSTLFFLAQVGGGGGGGKDLVHQ